MSTPRRNYSNTAVETQLSSNISAAATSLTVGSASGYPDPPFTITLGNEVILVGAKVGTVFSSLTRGFDGTTAIEHFSGEVIKHVAVADDFSYRWLDTIVHPDAGDTDFDDEHDDGDASAWTQVTPTGSATWTESHGMMSVGFTGQLTSDCAANLHTIDGLTFPLYVTTAARLLAPHADFAMHGLVFTDGTTSTNSCIWLMPYYDDSNPGRLVMSFRRGTLTNISTTIFNSEHIYAYSWLHMRLDWVADGVWRAWLSPDGITWTAMDQTNHAFTMTPTHYGYGVSSWGTATTRPRIATFEFFRVHTSKPSYWVEV